MVFTENEETHGSEWNIPFIGKTKQRSINVMVENKVCPTDNYRKVVKKHTHW